MAEEFDATAAAAELAAAVQGARATTERLKPAAERMPLFTVQPDGSVTDAKGKVLRGPVAPAPAKGQG
jgi:hypothetical protein